MAYFFGVPLSGAVEWVISPTMLISAFPAHERGRALGLNAVIVALGVSVGPTLGGIITENFSWNWIFYVNVPLGIIGIIATLRVLRESAKYTLTLESIIKLGNSD